jgi:hypothetical protein
MSASYSTGFSPAAAAVRLLRLALPARADVLDIDLHDRDHALIARMMQWNSTLTGRSAKK